jgi:hypothetical protein
MVKRRLSKIIRTVKFEGDYSGQELFVFVGLLMATGTFLKLMGVIYLDSDWFWFVAGLGLTVEGAISISKQRKFNKKYKVLSREEFEKLVGNQK